MGLGTWDFSVHETVPDVTDDDNTLTRCTTPLHQSEAQPETSASVWDIAYSKLALDC